MEVNVRFIQSSFKPYDKWSFQMIYIYKKRQRDMKFCSVRDILCGPNQAKTY